MKFNFNFFLYLTTNLTILSPSTQAPTIFKVGLSHRLNQTGELSGSCPESTKAGLEPFPLDTELAWTSTLMTSATQAAQERAFNMSIQVFQTRFWLGRAELCLL